MNNRTMTKAEEIEWMVQNALETGGLDWALVQTQLWLSCPGYLQRVNERFLVELRQMSGFLQQLRDGWRPNWDDRPEWSSVYTYEGTFRNHVLRVCTPAEMLGKQLGHKPSFDEIKSFILEKYAPCSSCPHESE